MRTILTTSDDFPSAGAGVIAAKLCELQATLKRDVNVVFATGRTMVGVLQQLTKFSEIDWQRIQAFHLDEFDGLAPDHAASFGFWLDQNLFTHVGIRRDHIHYMGSQTLPLYTANLKRLGGADLILLGLGLDGHLAFNKSGSAFNSRARRIRLTPDVIEAKASEYPQIRLNPFANTLGLKDIMSGRKLILLANGAAKADIVARVYFGSGTPKIPATILRRHKHVTTVLDCEAAALLNAVDVRGVTPQLIRDQLALYSQTYSGIRHAGMGLDPSIGVIDQLVAFLYGYAYGCLLLKKSPKRKAVHVLLGRDSRPTGQALAVAQSAGIRKALLGQNRLVEITDLGIVTTPLLESAIRCVDAQGAVMITASHNPIPQNGWKFMSANKEKRGALLDAGSLIDADAKRSVIRTVRTLVGKMCDGGLALERFIVTAECPGSWPATPIPEDDQKLYRAALKFYTDEIKNSAGKLDKELVVVNDYNGGAAARVNVSVLHSLGFKNVIGLGTELGVCDHAIEPVGAAMDAASSALVLNDARVGVVYDFDADRGNLVWLKPDGTAAEVSPQNVAAMNVAIELLKHNEFDRRKHPKGLAVVGHCASSGSIRSIARLLNSAYFIVETGEVNVVKKMAELEKQGFLVAVGVEGYSGGTVFPGSKCRDGLRTLLAVTHLLSSQKMIDAWRRRFNAEIVPPHRRDVFVSKLLETLPQFVSLQDKISDVELSPREFRVALEESLKKLTVSSEAGLTVSGVTKSYRSILIEYSGETKYFSRPLAKPAGYGLRSRFEDGGWIARFVDLAGGESVIWVRGSKTEVGIYKRLVDSSDPDEAAELKNLLDKMCSMCSRRTGGESKLPGNVLLVSPGEKAPKGWPSRELPANSDIIYLHAVAGEAPPAAECLIAALHHKKLRNRVVQLSPSEFSLSVLSERRPVWIVSARDSRIESIVTTFNGESTGPKTQLVLFDSGEGPADCFFSFTGEVLRDVLAAVREHKTQVRRTRYDLSLDKLCRATCKGLRASGTKLPKDHVGAYQFFVARLAEGDNTVDPGPPKLDDLAATDRVYFISPHPDDMEIAAGGLVQSLSVRGVPIENIVLSLGGNGVQPTAAEKRMLRKRFGDWQKYRGELRREEVLRAAALLQNNQKGSVECSILADGYDEAALVAAAEKKIADIFEPVASRDKSGRIVFFLPHPEDDHPRHRSAHQLFFTLLKKYSAAQGWAVEVFLYLSPWAGSANSYFISRQNLAYFKSNPAETSRAAELLDAARLRKQGIFYLVHELIGGFGGERKVDAKNQYAAESFFLP